MKLGVFTASLSSKSLEEALRYLKDLGVQAVELGAGGYPGTAHVNAEEFLKDDEKIKQLQDTVEKYDIEIAALSVHGNPIHPQKDIADKFHKDFENTVKKEEFSRF